MWTAVFNVASFYQRKSIKCNRNQQVLFLHICRVGNTRDYLLHEAGCIRESDPRNKKFRNWCELAAKCCLNSIVKENARVIEEQFTVISCRVTSALKSVQVREGNNSKYCQSTMALGCSWLLKNYFNEFILWRYLP